MTADPSFLHKLWDKGVDITASVVASTISASIIALIATWTWGFKRKRDLRLEADKQLQHHRIEQELETHEANELALRARDARERELTALVKSFEAASGEGSAVRLHEAWDMWLKWLYSHNLEYRPKNQEIIRAWGSVDFRNANSNRTATQFANGVISAVQKTDIA
jgi:hypothetical protein